MRPRWAHLTLAFGALLVAGVGFACSQRSPATNSTAAANHANASSKAVLADAVNQSSQGDTVQFALKMTLSGEMTGSQDVTGSGSANFSSQEAAMTLHVLGTDVDVVAAQDVVYLKTAVLGSDWYRLDPSVAQRGGASQLFAAAFIDPQKQFELLKQASTDVQSLGTEQVNGTTTTHYHATVDLTKGAADSGVPQSDLQELQSLGITTIPADVWVDAQGRIVRISLNYAVSGTTDGSSGNEQVQATVDYSGYGEPVNISTPPASQVRDFRESGFGRFLGGSANGSSASQ